MARSSATALRGHGLGEHGNVGRLAAGARTAWTARRGAVALGSAMFVALMLSGAALAGILSTESRSGTRFVSESAPAGPPLGDGAAPVDGPVLGPAMPTAIGLTSVAISTVLLPAVM